MLAEPMRRPIFFTLIAAILAGLAITTFALAGNGETASSRDKAAWASLKTASSSDRGLAGHAVLSSLAKRLGVTTRELRRAMKATARRQLARAAKDGTITARQRRALTACLEGRRRGCDRRVLRGVASKLRRSLLGAGQATELPELKRTLSEDFAAELGKPAGEVVAAVRAELSQRLDQGVALGVVTEEGRKLALGCFDDPGSCDVAALQRQLRFG